MSDSVRPHRQQPTRLPHPWDSLGKNTGVGCHFLLQRMKVKSEREVAQSCPTLRDPMDCSLPGSSIHRIFQARVLEWQRHPCLCLLPTWKRVIFFSSCFVFVLITLFLPLSLSPSLAFLAQLSFSSLPYFFFLKKLSIYVAMWVLGAAHQMSFHFSHHANS